MHTEQSQKSIKKDYSYDIDSENLQFNSAEKSKEIKIHVGESQDVKMEF